MFFLQLSLRDNPLVVRFVRDLAYNPPSLLELAGRVIKSKNVPYEPWDLPQNLTGYLGSAHQCVNPKCQGIIELVNLADLFLIVYAHCFNRSLL